MVVSHLHRISPRSREQMTALTLLWFAWQNGRGIEIVPEIEAARHGSSS
jgi:hypothetical protein